MDYFIKTADTFPLFLVHRPKTACMFTEVKAFNLQLYKLIIANKHIRIHLTIIILLAREVSRIQCVI